MCVWQVDGKAKPARLKGLGSIVKAEDRAVGRVTRAVYAAYLGAWSKYYLIPGVMLGFAMVQQGAQVSLLHTAAAWLA